MNNLLRPRNWEPACGTERSAASANYMDVLPGVLRCRPLRRTVQVRLETDTLRLPGGTPICVVSRQQFMNHPGLPGQGRHDGVQYLLVVSGCEAVSVLCSSHVPKDGKKGLTGRRPVRPFLCVPWSA